MFVIKDLLKMIRDIRSANKNVGIWGRALNMPQILGGLVLIYTLEGVAIFDPIPLPSHQTKLANRSVR